MNDKLTLNKLEKLIELETQLRGEYHQQLKDIKALQKDLAAERAELAELKKYDPQRLRKNLDASKKKLADKTAAADKLQKSLNQTRAENTQLEQKVKDLEAQLAAADTEQADQTEDGAQAAA
jgi:chromosome segregation ATPase